MKDLWKRECIKLFDYPTDDEESNRNIYEAASVIYQECYQIMNFATWGIQPKSNLLSKSHRVEGNECFDSGNWLKAVSEYTSALRHAAPGSINASFLYARRSRAFFKLRSYGEALSDIALAENFKLDKKLKLPKELQSVLQERKKKSIEQKKLTMPNVLGILPYLDYPHHNRYPAFIKFVDINWHLECGRHMIANSTIRKGKIITKEEAFVTFHSKEMERCNTCLHKYTSLKPCKNCTYAVYCHNFCENSNQTHKFECGSFVMNLGNSMNPRHSTDPAFKNVQRARLTLRTVFKALAAFSESVTSLMGYVEKMLREDPFELPTKIEDDISKYHLFFKLRKFNFTTPSTVAIYNFVYAMEVPKIKQLFVEPAEKNFLMHLIEHHTAIILANTMDVSYYLIMAPSTSLYNHSCDPNARRFNIRNTMFVETTRQIEIGEQICISYISEASLQLSTKVRRRIIMSECGFYCECRRCQKET